jgi:1-pyrroline-5-carboxylate dehydrogenase
MNWSGFTNELTLDNLKAKGKENEFHEAYGAAYGKALKGLGKRYPNCIGSQERFSKLGTFEDICPYNTRTVIGHFSKGGREDVIDAVKISQGALDAWKRMRVADRCSIFEKAAAEMASRKYEFAAMLTLENGKNRYEAMAEVDEAIDYLRYYPHVLREQRGYVLEMDGAVPCNETRSLLLPLGVLGVISPFNFPLAIATGMVTGALVTGNAAILKPASDTPLMGWMLHELLVESGVPSDVFHFVSGSGESVGAELIANKGVAALVFTGSRAVGMNIIKSSAELGKRPPIVEMGGKNPTVVSDKADLGKAVEGVCRSAFGYSGQKCSATSRVIVNRAVADRFTKMIADWLRNKKVGDPSEKDTFIGPLINNAAMEKFKKTIELAARDRKIVTGGHVVADSRGRHGFYVEPTVIAHPASNDELVTKELFLPVLVLLTYSDIKNALDIANSTEYGLTAGIFSDDPDEVQFFFDHIQAGVAYANRAVGSTTGSLVGRQPFVGWKSSGVTGKGAGGPYYLLQFLQEQSRTLCE